MLIKLSPVCLIIAFSTSFGQTPCPLGDPTSCYGLCEGGPGNPADPCLYCETGCNGGYERLGNCCCPPTPIVIDTNGGRFDMTSLEGGVLFDMTGDGRTEQVSWTATASSTAFLVLDRNGNGVIDDASELFGNLSPKPSPPFGARRNGFLALAVYHTEVRGGNGDGAITMADEAFQHLRLWHDRNHNGETDAGELSPLPDWGIVRIELDYRLSGRRDQHGNFFRYRAKVDSRPGTGVSTWAYDVLLRVRPNGVSQSEN